MGKKKRKSATEQMLDALNKSDEELCPNFPPTFLLGLRSALDAGCSAEEITSLLVLFSGIYEASARMSGEELIERSKAIADVMMEDTDISSRHRLRIEKNNEWRRRIRCERWSKKTIEKE